MLRVRARARVEIAEAFEWYLARSSDAPADFLAEIDAALNLIAEAPERFPVVRGRLRRVLLRRIPICGLLQGVSDRDQPGWGDSRSPTSG